MELFQLVQEQDRTRIETQTPSDQRSIEFDGVERRELWNRDEIVWFREEEGEREYSFANSSPNNSEANSMVVPWNSGRTKGWTKGSPGFRPWRNFSCLFPVHLRSPPLLHSCATASPCRGWMNACSCGWIKEWTMGAVRVGNEGFSKMEGLDVFLFLLLDDDFSYNIYKISFL